MPIVFFSLVSGMAADALDRRRLMLVTQSVMTVLALILTVVTFRGLTAVWPIYLLAASSSAAGAFDLPARQALLPNLVPREHLPNAISLNTIMAQVASVAGPGVGGAVIAWGGVGWVYAFNTLSFLVVIAALLMMRMDTPVEGGATDRSQQLHDRRCARGTALRLSRTVDPVDDAAGFLRDVLFVGNGAAPNLAQTCCTSARTATGGSTQPRGGRGHRERDHGACGGLDERRGLVLLAAVGIYGLATAAFGLSHWFWLSFACLAATGAADTVSMVFRNLIRQLETPNRLRGRMVGVNMVFFMGGPQLGELQAGLVASWLGPVVSVVSGGIGCVIATAWVTAATPMLRAYRGRPHVVHRV